MQKKQAARRENGPSKKKKKERENGKNNIKVDWLFTPRTHTQYLKRLRGRIEFCCRQDCERIDIIYLFCCVGESRIHYKPELVSDKMDPRHLRNCK